LRLEVEENALFWAFGGFALVARGSIVVIAFSPEILNCFRWLGCLEVFLSLDIPTAF